VSRQGISRAAVVAVLATVVGSVGAAPSAAAPGDLDPAFSGDGKLMADFGFGGSGEARSVARQADGKIVSAGSVDGERLVVTRHNGDGSLDAGFSGDGRQFASLGPDTAAVDVAIQTDGKIVVAARTAVGDFESAFGLLRFDADGSPDTTFSDDGRTVTSSFGPAPGGGTYGAGPAAAMALQTDGKIVVVGGDFGLRAARYTTGGTLDDTFSGDGLVALPYEDEQLNEPEGVAVQSDGKVVVVGAAASAGGDREFAVARLTSSGGTDSTFSDDGYQYTGFWTGGPSEAGDDSARDVVVQPDGKIVVAGAVTPTDYHQRFGVARYNGDGSLDSGFSGDGRQVTTVGDGDDDAEGANAVALAGDGKIMVVGDVYYGGELGIVRYGTDGTLDGSFSGDGVHRTVLGEAGDGSTADVLVAPDGKAVVAGQADSDLMLARYDAGGALDASLATDGIATVPFSGDEAGSAILLQPDGKLVALGTNDQLGALRYLPDGTPDTTFSGDGLGLIQSVSSVGGAALQLDGRILVSGTIGGGDEYEGRIARFTASGAPDSSLSGGSWPGVGVLFNGGLTSGAGVTRDPDGKLVFANRVETFDGDEGECDEDGSDGGVALTLQRFTAAGSGDPTFAPPMVRDFNPLAVTTQADRKIVVAGYSCTGDFRIVRLRADGSLDPSFDGDGKQTTDFAGAFDVARAVSIQADGKIVAAGYASYDVAVARYNTDGSLDAGFSGDGKLTTGFGGEAEAATGVAVHSGGKIVVFGYSATGGASTRVLAVARFEPDGSPDAGFSGDGMQLTDVGGRGYSGGVAIQSDGDIVGVGSGEALETGLDVVVVRYDGGDAGGPAVQPSVPAETGKPSVTSKPPTTGGATPASPVSKPKVTAACKRARSARGKAQRLVKAARRKLRAATRIAAKRKWRAALKKRNTSLRKAQRRTRRACS
jgi:uncharacterized delta-60 repeat protein